MFAIACVKAKSMSWRRDQDHLSRVLEEELKCPVCLEEFVEPKSLSCSHTVCKDCLSNIAQHTDWNARNPRRSYVRCPTCRFNTELDFPGGIDKLPTNYIVTTLISGKGRVKEVKEVEDRLDKCKQALQVRQDLLTKIIDLSESVGHRREQVESDIRQTAESIVQMVRASEEELIQEVNLAAARQQRELKRQREVMQNLIAYANDRIKRVEQQINSLPTRKVIEEKPSILSQVRDIDAIGLAFEIPEMDSIEFIPNMSITESEQLTKLGKLVVGSEQYPDGSAISLTVADYSQDKIQTHAFGMAGSDGGEFNLPWGVAIRDDGCIAVADHANSRIQIFDHQGTFLHVLTGDEAEKICLPTGIDFDLDHNLVTFDSESRNVKILDSAGQLIRNMSNSIELGSRVEGISIDTQGRIIITDSSNGRVLVFHHSGHLCLEFGGNGKNKLERPSSAVFYQGRYIVSDTFNHCLKVYNRHGVFLRQIGRPGMEPGQFRQPRGLTVDLAGNILVCDSGNHRVQILDCDGNFVRSFECLGSEADNFCLPYAIAVGKQGEVVVSDCNNHCIQIFRFPLLHAEANSE